MCIWWFHTILTRSHLLKLPYGQAQGGASLCLAVWEAQGPLIVIVFKLRNHRDRWSWLYSSYALTTLLKNCNRISVVNTLTIFKLSVGSNYLTDAFLDPKYSNLSVLSSVIATACYTHHKLRFQNLKLETTPDQALRTHALGGLHAVAHNQKYHKIVLKRVHPTKIDTTKTWTPLMMLFSKSLNNIYNKIIISSWFADGCF